MMMVMMILALLNLLSHYLDVELYHLNKTRSIPLIKINEIKTLRILKYQVSSKLI